MPGNELVDHVLEPLSNLLTTPSERLVLKMAAAFLKQIDPDYEYAQEADDRLKLTREEMDWLPEKLEVWDGIVVASAWPIPEHMAAVEREEAAIQELWIAKVFNMRQQPASMFGGLGISSPAPARFNRHVAGGS